ncbi:hypothetical protein BKA67DRAFT_337930 [Truncatella angustata]|uniref:Uncharacterized protein n=1 Tax=Truncatella angustata TaxID=152316 RepID=A0A9P8ZVA2_9PEZI|nr:uncharacterized protein BKA67DRAFT_337930 [Truncatella angustata]KAH6651781.1 hypothetical protein BKA67DRAFT_337930 [Truncatella angustata]
MSIETVRSSSRTSRNCGLWVIFHSCAQTLHLCGTTRHLQSGNDFLIVIDFLPNTYAGTCSLIVSIASCTYEKGYISTDSTYLIFPRYPRYTNGICNSVTSLSPMSTFSQMVLLSILVKTASASNLLLIGGSKRPRI